MSKVTKARARCAARSAGAVWLAVGVIGAAHAAQRSGEPRWVPDSLTVAITARLAAERFSRITHLRVETERRGVVSLSGNTGSRREAVKAASIARGTEGVLRVDNHIIVGEGTR